MGGIEGGESLDQIVEHDTIDRVIVVRGGGVLLHYSLGITVSRHGHGLGLLTFTMTF